MVTNTEKRNFLEWFLKTYELQKKECHWLLSYFMSKDNLLEKLHFVLEEDPEKRMIFMSTTCVDSISFRFSKGKLITTDVERAFHHIRLYPEEEIYVMLAYENVESCSQYAAVREEAPMEEYKITSDSWYSLLAEMILDEALEKFQKDRLYKEINDSLEEKDKEKFMKLSLRWAKLHEEE